MEIIDHQVVRNRIRQSEMQATAQAEAVDIADPLVVEQIELIAVALLVEAGDARQHLVAHDRDVEGALELAQLIVAKATADVSAELARRLGRCEQDRAPGRVRSTRRRAA